MDFRLQWVDVAESLDREIQPVVFIDRPKVGGDDRPDNGGIFGTAMIARFGEFWVPISALNSENIAWRLTKNGNKVRVPLMAYDTSSFSKSMLVAAGLEMGMRAAYDLAGRYHTQPAEVTLIVGHRVDETEQNGYRYYFGMAIRV